MIPEAVPEAPEWLTEEVAHEELGQLLDRARALVAGLRAIERPEPTARTHQPSSDGACDGAADGERRIAALEEEVRALEARFVEAERQNERLMQLYVATYQLHATLNPHDVLQAISEIVVDLVGADRFALLVHDAAVGRSGIVLRHGFDEEIADRSLLRYAGPTYPGGDSQVDAALADGRLRWGDEGGGPEAVVPLNVHGRTVGALVILRLLGHRRGFGPAERELLDLLAAHAACALFAAQSYATADRKLRKLAGILDTRRRAP